MTGLVCVCVCVCEKTMTQGIKNCNSTVWTTHPNALVTTEAEEAATSSLIPPPTSEVSRPTYLRINAFFQHNIF